MKFFLLAPLLNSSRNKHSSRTMKCKVDVSTDSEIEHISARFLLSTGGDKQYYIYAADGGNVTPNKYTTSPLVNPSIYIGCSLF
jgi:hypothetical protein